MSDWNFWYNGEIVSFPKQQLCRGVIEELIGCKFLEIAYAFPKLHTVLLYSRNLAANRIKLNTGVELLADGLICKFYYPLYQWQCLPLELLESELKSVDLQFSKVEDDNDEA